jgi:pimeloyl-ACP methyl ester carboxylesterase
MPSRDIKVGDRTLTIHEHGAPDGPVILHHHGTPLAGGPMDLWVEDARARGARLVCFDRPGYSGSTPAPGRTVGDAAADVAAIMDALGVERFVTWGISGGGPHALACAALLPDRVAAVASLASIAPFDAPGLNYFSGMGEDNIKEFGLTMAGREYIEPYAEAVGEMMRQGSVEQLAEGIASIISEVDRVALIDGGVGEYWAGAMPATFAQGAAGWVDDNLAFARPFGFAIDSISVPTLVVHGHKDQMVPLDHGRWLAGMIPGAEAWISEDEGHLTLYANRVRDVHGWLLQHI